MMGEPAGAQRTVATTGPGWSPFEGGRSDPWAAGVRAQLLSRRIVMLRGALDDALAAQVIAELMTLDDGRDQPVVLHVDSAGGPLHAAFGVIDTVDLLRVPLEAVCVGRAEGSAAALVAAAPRRLAAPHARLRLSEPPTSVRGRAAEVEAWSAQHTAEVGRLVERLAQATGRPSEHLEADLAAGRWFTADEAVGYGLVDAIWGPAPGNPPSRPLGYTP
jgi:ATP-dependent Clp protease protease subunit